MLYFMKDMPQSSQLNPAHKSVYKTSIVLPSCYANAESTVFSYNHIFTKGEYTQNIDLEKLFQNLKNQNIIEGNAALDVFGIYITSDKVSLNFFIREKLNSFSYIDSDLGELLSKGTAHPDNLGQVFNLNPTLEVSHYREYGMGFNYNIKDRVTIGFNAKYLSGIGNIKMNSADITIQTIDASNYPIVIGVQGPINTTGLTNIFDASGNFDSDGILAYLAGGAGHGYSFDFGITYQHTDNWLFEFAATNIGQIHWRNGRRDYELGADSYNSFRLEGATPNDLFSNNSENISNAQYDSISALFDMHVMDSQEQIDYTTTLPLNVNGAASYDFGHKFIIGATVGFSYYEEYFNPKVSVSMNKRFADFIGLGVSYSADKSGINKIGAAVTVGFPGLKAYAMSDDVVKIISDWQEAQSLGIRFGINLNFGYVKKNYLNKKKTRASQIMEAKW